MEKEFIPWPNYVVCPECKSKVDIPKSWQIFQNSGEKKSVRCPNCQKIIEYVDINKIKFPPYSVE